MVCSFPPRSMTVWDLYIAAIVFLWALMLGIVNMQNKRYVFMVVWIVLTGIIASAGAVRLVLFIMTWALVATIALSLLERLCIGACFWLRRVAHDRALAALVRRARIAAAAA